MTPQGHWALTIEPKLSMAGHLHFHDLISIDPAVGGSFGYPRTVVFCLRTGRTHSDAFSRSRCHGAAGGGSRVPAWLPAVRALGRTTSFLVARSARLGLAHGFSGIRKKDNSGCLPERDTPTRLVFHLRHLRNLRLHFVDLGLHFPLESAAFFAACQAASICSRLR